MATLGNVPAEAYTNTVKDSFSGNGSATAFTMSLPTVTNDVRVVVENVIQDPTVAYSVSGTTLTFTSAPPTGTNNIYVVHLGPAVMTTVPPAEIADATTFASSLTVQGAFTSVGIDDNADAVALTIDGSENVLIGKTATGGNVAGMQIINGSFFSHVRDGGVVQVLNRKSSDGDILSFEKDNTAVGSIGNGSNNLVFYLAGTQNAVKLVGPAGGVDAFAPASTSGLNRDNAMDLGWSSNRFKDAYLSGGVYLGGTGSANKLDDFEEGLYTVSAQTGSGSITLDSTNNKYSYVKVGKLVTVTGRIDVSSVSSPSGSLALTLPFTVSTGVKYESAVSLFIWSATSSAPETGLWIGWVTNGSNTISLRYGNSNTPSANVANYIQAGTEFRIGVSYETDA